MRAQLLLCFMILSIAAQGQGCIPVRNIVGFGQFMRSQYEMQEEPTTWLVNVNTRYAKIARSYVGTERTNLPPEDERINETFTMNVSIVRLLSRGWSIGMDLPLSANARTTWQEHDPPILPKFITRLTLTDWVIFALLPTSGCGIRRKIIGEI